MRELLKREVSLTVLKVRLLDASANSAPASSVDSTANQTLTPNQRIFCELQVTGNAEERGLVAPTQATNRAPSRRKRSSSRPTYEACETDTPSSLSRTLAQWSFTPEEIQLPVDYRAAVQFRDRPNVAAGWVADMARFAVSKFLSEMRADTLERFASAANWLPSGKPMLPMTMMRQLKTLLPEILQGDNLWLELAEPTGYLPLLPWEEMLRSVTPAPILRLSPHAVQALSPDRKLSVVLCLSVPSNTWTPTAEQLASLSRAVRGALPERSTVHVFADDLCHAPFVAAQKQMGVEDTQGRVIRLYDLPDNMSAKEQRDELWKAWIVRSLAGRAADIVHCVAPAMLFADHARLVLSLNPKSDEEPEKNQSKAARAMGRPLSYVTPLEFCNSLTHLGAWAAVFSAPSRGSGLAQMRMGLRLLVDQIGRLRPGIIRVHDWRPVDKAFNKSFGFCVLSSGECGGSRLSAHVPT
jgi:hypothetical protein